MAVVNFTPRSEGADGRRFGGATPRERSNGYRLPPFRPARRANRLGRLVDRLLGR